MGNETRIPYHRIKKITLDGDVIYQADFPFYKGRKKTHFSIKKFSWQYFPLLIDK